MQTNMGRVKDWLVTPLEEDVSVTYNADANEVTMENGLIRRTFAISPNAATIAFDNLMTGASLLRGVKPEAMVELDGQRYQIGGLLGQEEYGYFRREWLADMSSDPASFQYSGYTTGQPKARLSWKRKRYAQDLPWPPLGASVTLHFQPPEGVYPGLQISVHYEMYAKVPVLAKWLTIQNGTKHPIKLNTFTSELLAVVEQNSTVDTAQAYMHPPIHVESDYAFLGMDSKGPNKTTFWIPDPQYTSQVNYNLESPVMLESRPPLGPNVVIPSDDTFTSFYTFELVFDSTELERRSLAQRRMYKTIAPWITENPILMHLQKSDYDSVKEAIDQCATVGFEMLILSFGSGFTMENTSEEYIEYVKSLVAYAHSKGIEIGGYSLLASRSISLEQDVINPKTGQPGQAIFENSPCLGSAWGLAYFEKMQLFIEQTGMDLLEHDGSYPGDICASVHHPGHQGLADSQWTQWRQITEFYKWCRGNGIYLNVPDWYFLSGSNKTGMGYRETNWSLPRERQLILGRQNIYDGTWEKTPSMGWMFVPLVQYHGGGEAATIEPLCEHLDAYEAHLANNFGCGVQACYRGPRLYDTEETKQLVTKWVSFYKTYRDILDSDIIHIRRADGRDIDCLLHVNPTLENKGLLMVYNPLAKDVTRVLSIPLYYTGLTDTVQVREQEGSWQTHALSRDYTLELTIKMKPQSSTWFVCQALS